VGEVFGGHDLGGVDGHRHGDAAAHEVNDFCTTSKKAMAALGDRFDPREFHAEVLKDGAVPLGVLEAKIDRWIASKKG